MGCPAVTCRMELRCKAKESLIAALTPRQSKQCLHDLQVKTWTMVLADVPFLPLPSSSGSPPQVVHARAYCKMRNVSKYKLCASNVLGDCFSKHAVCTTACGRCAMQQHCQLPGPLIWVDAGSLSVCCCSPALQVGRVIFRLRLTTLCDWLWWPLTCASCYTCTPCKPSR